MMIKLYNTLTKKKQPFKPLKDKVVGLYACGPTVYRAAHIGNLSIYIFEDILRRTLEFNGYKVNHIMNITDVGHLTSDADTGQDKVEQAAKEAGKTASEITQHFADLFVKDLKRLNIELPQKFAWASKYIKEQIELIKRLEKKGYTYKTNDGIYFDTDKFKEYGVLGGAGAGKARVKHSRGKKRETDFALWKFSRVREKRQQEWPSPWGVGYPGWHVECSAISAAELGQPFDIHAGGEDHIAIHHNNEIAQSQAAYGKPLAKFWIHGAFTLVNRAKMAKSRGNAIVLDDIIAEGFDPLAFRYLVVASHYRRKLNFSAAAMKNASRSLEKLRSVFSVRAKGGRVCQKYKRSFLAAINNDLNMSKAFEVVWSLVRTPAKTLADKQATLLDFDQVLGLDLKNYSVVIPAEVKKLVAKREIARKKKDFRLADKLRRDILNKGFAVEDTAEGSKITKK